MYRGGTVKQFKDTLDEMKKVYNYKDEKTRLSVMESSRNLSPSSVCIVTTDEGTGVEVRMFKEVEV